MGAPAPGTVTVWSDIGCPWASLALHTLRAAARARGRELLVDHRAFPLELFNAEPTPKYIVEPEVIVIGALRPELGWRVWSGREADYPSTTLPAMEAVQAAKAPEVGGLRASDELDAALRHAFYAESRCISVLPVILEIAGDCPAVDARALGDALARGAGRAEVFGQWRTARGPDIAGSPQLFAPGGWSAHNPGARFTWTGDPRTGGLPRLTAYSPRWAEELLESLDRPEPESASAAVHASP
ncbi:DsbA family protein [Streptomyces luteireticuli]|uniref:DsbA family oxidoreductase n=1 Tax=Streptomyces luteireticuli TaxID=173858 RepID=UPI0035567E18